MVGPDDDTPPEVPEEFVAAYRAAYERALAQQSDQPHRRGPDVNDTEDAEDTDELPARLGRIRLGTHKAPPAEPTYQPVAAPRERPDWLVPLILLLLVVLLIMGAYVVGRVFAGQVDGGAPARDGGQSGAAPYQGDVRSIRDVTAETGCTAEPGTDASGAKVEYDAANMTDGKPETTWRCDGDASGRKIRLNLDSAVPIGEVGLIPGYAKTDEKDGTDRYAENNRITKVRWTIGSTVVEQTLSADPKDRSLRTLRIPRTTASTVTLEILAVAKGPRNTTAISEVSLGEAD